MDRSFTTKYDEQVRILKTHVGISLPLTSNDIRKNELFVCQCAGIWDTGASRSVITRHIVKNLDLKPVREAKVYYAGGTIIANAYLVSIILENDILLDQIIVTEAELNDDEIPDHERFDVLLGMDVIGQGDFAITNYRKRTTVSFRVPSKEELDFTK